MSFKNQPPRCAPTDLDIPVASAVYEEDYGTTTSTLVSNTRVPNGPNGRSSNCDKLIVAGKIAGIFLILFLLVLIIYM